MKPIAMESKPEEPLTHDSRACAGRLDSATPIPVSYLTFTHRISSEHLNESVGAITCTTPNCASVDQCNQQYSIYALTDSSGNVSELYAYTAYGQPTFLNASATVQTSSAAGNRYTYTSREWDQSIALHHFRARWMSGLTGRFLTRDPVGYVDGNNLYGNYFGLWGQDWTGTSCSSAPCIQRCMSLPVVGSAGGGVGGGVGATHPRQQCIDGCRLSAQRFLDWFDEQIRNGKPNYSGLLDCPCDIGCTFNRYCSPGVGVGGGVPQYPVQINAVCAPGGWYFAPPIAYLSLGA